MSKSIKSLKPYNQTKTSFSELKPFDIPEEEKFSLKKYYEEQRRKWEEEQLRKQAEPLQSAPLPVNFTSAAAALAARKGGGALDLANQVARTNTETMPRIARGAQAAQDRIAGYNDKTRYTDVQSDINNTKNVRAGAARRGRDTTAYDTAIGMLENYSKQRYRLDDTDTSPEAVEDKRKKYESNLQEIDKLEKQIYDMTGGKRQGFGEDRTEVNKLQARVDALKAENTAYERLQSASDRTSEINSKQDYSAKSVPGNYNTPKTREEVNNYIDSFGAQEEAGGLFGGWKQLFKTVKSPLDNKETTNKLKELPDILGSFLSAEKEIAANNPAAYEQIRKDFAESGFAKDTFDQSPYSLLQHLGYYYNWDVMNEKEIGAYYYLLNTEGKDAAYSYLERLSDTLQKRGNYENKLSENEAAADTGTLNNLDWLLRSASSVPDRVAGGAQGFIDNQYRMLTGQELRPYASEHGASLSATATREAAGAALDEQFGKSDKWYAVNPSDIYNGVMSTADMATAYLIGPEAYGLTMGMSAAEDSARDLWEQGEDNNTIAAVSTASGIAEMLFEELSVEQLWKAVNLYGAKSAKNLALRYLHNMLRQGLVEGSEEVLTEAANMAVDYAVRGDRSDVADYSAGDVANRLYRAGVGGAIGGLLGGGGATTLDAAGAGARLADANRYYKATGQSISNAGNIKSLIDLAYQSADAKIRQSGQELEKLNRKQSTGNAVRDRIRQSRTQKRAGQLYTELQKNNIEQFKNAEQSVRLEAIENLYAEQIDDKERKDPTVPKVAKLIDKAVTGQTLTQREQRTVSSPSAQAVINKIKEDTDLLESQTKSAKAKALGDYAKAQKLVMPKETETINDDDVNTDEFIISKKDDGKVYKDNEVVETGAITDISGDDIKVETGDGNTDSVKTLSMPTEQAVLYQSLMDVQNETGIELSPAIANDIVSLAQSTDNDLSLSQSVRAATQALVKGYTNNSNEYSSDSYASKLSDSTRQKFYNLGRELATAQTAEQQQRVLDRVSAQDNMREGTVTYEDDIDYNKLDRRRKASADFVEAYAKVNGTDVVFFASKPDGKGRRSSKYVTENRLAKDGEQAPNGFWHDGKMYIDINAGMNGEGLVLFTMSHETVHMIREGSPEDYKALADFLISKYAEKGIDVDDLVRLKQEEYGAPKYLALKEMGKSTNLTYDEALEEVIADSCESFLLDLADAKRGAEISQELKKENPTLWDRIKDALYNILQRVRNAYRLAKPQSREAQIIAQMKDIIEPAYEIYVRGYTNAARNLRNMEGDRQSNSKMQSRSATDSEYLSAVERGDMETAQRMVDEAAEKAGYNIKAYHGASSYFNVFDFDKTADINLYGKGFYFTSDETDATDNYVSVDGADTRQKIESRAFELFSENGYSEDDLYGNDEDVLDKYNELYEQAEKEWKDSARIVNAYLKIKHPMIVNKNSKLSFQPLIVEKSKNNGYDGIIDYSVPDKFSNLDKDTIHYVVFSSEQIKSADPVTYDDDGNVIPLSERFNPDNKDIRYQERSEGYDFSDFEVEFGEEIEDTLAREFETHHEDIGEVLRNTADIEITAAKVNSIVNRIIKNNLGEIDSKSRELLSLEIQIALEQVNRKDAEAVTNDIISAVRDAIENAMIVDERSEDNYNELRQYFGNDKYYLTDKMLAYLARRGMSLGNYRNRMYQKINIVKQGTPNARKLSLESMHEVLDAPDEYLGFSADEWDSHEEDTPVILMDAFDTLKKRRMVAFTEYNNDEQELDERAVELAAKITGAIVQEKYNSRKNPYISKLVEDLRAKRTEAVKKQKEKNRKKLAELKQKERERADKREQELKEKYQEQRANARESRQRTEFRNRIRRIADNFNKRLNAPKAKQYIPQEFIKQTLDVLNLVSFKGKRGVTISSTLSDLRETYNELQDDYKGAYASPVEKMLSVISKRSKQEAKEWVPKRNKAIEQENKRLQKQGKPLKKYVTEADFTVNNMSLDLLDLVYKCFSSLDYTIRESVKMTDTKFKQDAHQLGRSWMAEIVAVPKEHSGAVSGWIQTMLSPERFFDRIAGFKKNSTSLQLYDMLNDGQLRMTQLEMEFTQIFDALIKDSKQLKSLYDTKHLVDIGLEDEDGNKVEITRGMMISLYMHLLNEDNTRHVMGGGLTVPDMIDYYKGDIKKAYGKGMQRVRVGALDYSKYREGLKTVIEEQLNEYEIAWVEAARDFFDVASRKALNDTTMKLYGFKRANVDHYFPIHTDSNYRAANFEAIQRDMSLENSGFMKERVKASNPILLEDIVDVVNHQISQVSKYCGMTLPIKNFQKVYSTTTRDFESSVQEVLNKKFSGTKNNTGATKYIDNLITDLTAGRSTDEGPIAKLLGRMRGFLAQSTLTLNPRVAIAQAASYSTAAAEIGWKPLMKALKNGGKNNRVFSRADQEIIAEISPYLWKRTQGYSNIEIGDINELRKQKHKVQGKVKKAMSWIEFFDGMTVGRLFYACQYYVDEQFPELKRGTEEYNKKLADVYNKVIERTQPNYTVAQRPDILRNPNALVKSLTMFMTQRLQNFNIVYSAAGKYNKYLKDYKAGINDVTAEDVKAAKVGLRRAIVSQTVSAATIVGMKLLADALLHSMTGYRDDDDELTAQSVSLKLLNNFADTIFGSVLFGSELYSLISSLVTGERYYGISLSGIDSLSDALDSVTKLRKGVDFDSINGVAKSICQLLGIPLANAEKIAMGVYNHAVDISEGEFMSFESGVDRTRKQDIHRIELAYNSGDKDKANKIKDELLKSQTDKGKTEKEALSWLRNGFTTTYKQQYIEAVKNNDTEKIKNIRELLYYTGVYGTLAEQDKAMQEWLKNEE